MVSFILGTGRFPSLSCNSNVLGPTSVLRLPETIYFDDVEVFNRFLLSDEA